MILDEITLHDFGVYAKRQTICLTPPAEDKPIVLFGGLNGVGKTTIFDAMQLCLFGQFTQFLEDEEGTYQEIVARRINKSSRWRQASVSMVFRRMENGEDVRYRVTRTWQSTPRGVREKLEVNKNQKTDKALAENWPRYMEEILPAKIARLFFFDGEKIEQYASPDNARLLVQTAVHNLLGMDSVEQLQKDLHTLERRKQSEKMPDAEVEKIAAKQAELDLLFGKIAKLEKDCEKLRVRKIIPAQQTLAEMTKRYQEIGGDLRDQQDVLERAAREADMKLSESKESILALADSQLPLSLVKNLLEDAKAMQLETGKRRQALAVLDALKKRNAALIKHLKTAGHGGDVIASTKGFFAEDLRELRKATGTRAVVDMSEDGETGLREVLRIMPAMQADALQLIRQHQTFVEGAENANLMVSSIPQEDSLREAKENRDALADEVATLKNKHELMKLQSDQLTRDANRLQSELDEMWERHAQAEISRKEKTRFVTHARGAREALAEFKQAVLHNRIGRIEQLVLDSYRSLLHKDALAENLSINPKTFEITLYGRQHEAIAPEQLSAGERQLLAISLLWGMAKASRKALPTAIDTPLGRLDSKHRNRLIENYFGFAGKQILLFSTDEEISGRYLQQLKPWIGRFYRLDYDESSASTTISEGVLGEN